MCSISNINNQFFKGAYKHVWRKEIPAGLSEAEVDFIQEIASLSNKAHVLDLMCGYGRHAIELGKRGVTVRAIDNLREYIEEIKITVENQNLPIIAVEEDAVSMNLEDTVFDAAICMGNSFAFFNKKE